MIATTASHSLRDENQSLRDRIEELEGLLGLSALDIPRTIAGLRPAHWPILGLLLKKRLVTKDFMFTALYGGRPECDQPGHQIIRVHVTHIRAALKPHGISISTDWGRGFFLTDGNREKLRALLEVE